MRQQRASVNLMRQRLSNLPHLGPDSGHNVQPTRNDSNENKRMRRTKPLCPSLVMLFLSLLWLGSAQASGTLQLAFADTQPGTWMTPELTLAGPLPGQFGSWIDLHVKPGDSLSDLFRRAGVRADQWRALLALDIAGKPLRNLHPGDHLRLHKTSGGQLAALRLRLDPDRLLEVDRKPRGLAAHIRQTQPRSRQVLVSGRISGTLKSSARRAGAPARIAKAMAHLYTAREDLAEKIRKGDQFSLVYTPTNSAQKQADQAPIIAANITTGGTSYRIFRHVDSHGTAHYYDAKGRSYEPGIERTPLAYTIVSSFFSMSRNNPALGVVRRHSGVDLAAPAGTTVHAAANGTVTFVGWRHGYGRLVKINHGSGYATRYAHMSKFAAGLAKGDRVKRGQTVGYVGASGLATGYHLHFEIRKNGVAHDPLTMPLPDGQPLAGTQLTAFSSRIQPLIARLSGSPAGAATRLASAAPAGGCRPAGAINAVLALAPGQVETTELGQVFCAERG